MDTKRLGAWGQFLGNLAIVAGIAIVIFELNQNKNLAYAELVTAQLSNIDDRFLTMQGEDPRGAFFKAEFCPDELTGDDVVTLSAYYESWVGEWLKMYRITQIAAFDTPWREVVGFHVKTVFSNPLARRWLRVYLEGEEDMVVNDHIQEVVERALAEPPGRRAKDLYVALLPKGYSSACGEFTTD